MKARIEYEGFDRVESLKLKRFLQIADHFARRWDKTVVLDAPRQEWQDIGGTQDENQTIHIHFYSFPRVRMPLYDEHVDYAGTLFCFPLFTEEFSIAGGESAESSDGAGNGAAVKCKPRPDYPVLYSPEGHAAAQVVKNHIFIFFDLAHKHWEGAEPVLWEILERAIPHLAMAQGCREESSSFSLLLAAHEKMRVKSITEKEKALPAFETLSRLLLKKELERIRDLAQQKRDEMVVGEAEVASITMRIEMIRGLLDNLRIDEELSDERLREEFELIHRYKGLRGIEVNGDELYIFTEPIEHAQAQTGEKKMLSQYKIVIKPAEPGRVGNGNTFKGIRMAEWGWLGPFHHPEGTIKSSYNQEPKSPCFGSQYVISVEKAFLDHDYKVLIAMLLNYLRLDNRSASPREPANRSREIYEPTPFYANDHIRERTCGAYGNFVRRFRGLFRKKLLQEELASANEKSRSMEVTWAEARHAWMLARVKAAFLRSYIDGLPVERELEDLYNIGALTFMKVGSDFVWIVFGPGKGFGALKNTWFSGTFRVLVKPLEGKIRIWGKTEWPQENEDGFLCERISSEGIPLRIPAVKALFARGMFGKALSGIYHMLRGGNLEGAEAEVSDCTREIVEKYLHENAFPLFDLPVYSTSKPMPSSDQDD